MLIDRKELEETILNFMRGKKSFAYEEVLRGIVFYSGTNRIEYLRKNNINYDITNKRVIGSLSSIPGLKLYDIDETNEILWNFIIGGVISTNFYNQALQNDTNFFVTEYGKKVLNDLAPSPFDHEGFLRDLSGLINQETSFYLIQSLECFNKSLYVPSAIMLGVAAENIILEISEIAEEKLTVKDKYINMLEKTKFQISWHIKALDDFVLPKLKGNSDNKKNDIKKKLFPLFEVIKLSRNEAGHPSKMRIGRDEAYANYVVFRLFCKIANDLRKWMEAQDSI